MKKLLIGLLALGSFSAFGLPTDYTCSLIDTDGSKVATANALISRSHIAFGEIKTGDEIALFVSNQFGSRLSVSLSNNSQKKFIEEQMVDLSGTGYIDGDVSKGKRSLRNPLEINFEFPNGLSVQCLRADDIDYSN